MRVPAVLLAGLTMVLGVSCSQNRLSDRDLKRQQQINSADVKRRELQDVAGRYAGELTGSGDGFRQSVRLALEVHDIPVTREGDMEAALTPKLVGSLRFLIGSEDAKEYVDAAIKQADFYPPQQRLEIVVEHEQFKDLVLSLVRKDRSWSGRWQAAALGTQGTLVLRASGE